MAKFNVKRPPRALFVDFDDEFMTQGNFNRLFNHTESISYLQLEDKHQKEFDVIIVIGPDRREHQRIAPHLYEICVGGNKFPIAKDNKGEVIPTLAQSPSVSMQLEIVDGLPPKIAKLAEETLIPLLSERDKRARLIAERPVPNPEPNVVQFPEHTALWQPVIVDIDKNVLIGYYKRIDTHTPEVWYLPYDIEALELYKWIEVLQEHWATQQPGTFSQAPDWRNESTWQTPNERKISSEIIAKEIELTETQKTIQSQIDELKSQLSSTKKNADSNERLLLTAGNDKLKDAVKKSLETLGFEVEDVDEKRDKTDLLEDLQVIEEINNDKWIAIVEVRGHKGGAQVKDLNKIRRHYSRYQREHAGAGPNASWYIVNHTREKSPSVRRLAMIEDSQDVADFSEGYDGLIIDTTILFRLLIDVLSGVRSKKEVRKLLIESRELLRYPEEK